MTAKTEFTPLSPADILGHEFARNVWCVTVDNTVSVETLSDPRFWVSTSNFFKIGDHIEAMPEDGSWWAHLIVRNVERSSIKTGLINHTHFEDAAVPSESFGDFEVKWRGPKARFGVIRKMDGNCLHAGFMTKTEAMGWAMEHARAFAA